MVQVLLKNRFEPIVTKDDLVVVPYYTDIRFITLKVFSVAKKGWSSFNVKVYELERSESESENKESLRYSLLNVPESKEWSAEYIIPTEYDLFPRNPSSTKIPSRIAQTASFSQWNEPALKNTAEIIRAFHPNHEYLFFSDVDARNFVLDYGTRLDKRVIDVYDTLIPDAFKADLFRYIYLYFFGGWYFDYKLVLREPLMSRYTEDTLVLCADYERENSVDIKNMESVYNGMIGTVPGSALFLRLVSAIIDNVLNRQRDFLLDIERRGTQGILDLTGPKLFYKVLTEFPEYQSYIKLKHYIENWDETNYMNFQVKDLGTKKVVLTKFGLPPSDKHYSKLWIRKLLFFQDPKVITSDSGYRYKVLTYPTGMIGFQFSIKGKILKVSHGFPWDRDVGVRIIDILTGLFADVYVGKSDQTEKSVILPESDIFRDPPIDNVFYIDRFPTDLVQKTKGVVAVTSIIFTSNHEIGNKEIRSVLTHTERYEHMVKQLEIVRRKSPGSTVILLESSLRIPKNMLKTLSRMVDYVVTFFDQDRELTPEVEPDKERLLYFHQHRNKSLGEMYSLVHLYDRLNLDFTHFFKLSGRYCPDPDFELENFFQDAPIFTDYEGECETVFYGFPKKYLAYYMEYLRLKIDPNNFASAESILTFFMKILGKYHRVERVKITGIGATHGREISL